MAKQEELGLVSVKSGEVNGLEMGVLADGTPYLTGRGLAAACGVSPGTILTLDKEWSPNSSKPRDLKILQLLRDQDYDGDQLFVKVVLKNGQEVNCHSDAVCMAILEYYAFETVSQGSNIAQKNFRGLAKVGLRTFVYTALGYDPRERLTDSWRNFQSRLLLNPVPAGYFSVFMESAMLVVPAIRRGLRVDSHTVPDGSIGIHWSKVWAKTDGDTRFGQRVKYPHTYPPDFPQSAANDVIEAWVYPLAAIAEFRQWLQDEYLTKGLPKYLKGKESDGSILPGQAAKIVSALTAAPMVPVLPESR